MTIGHYIYHCFLGSVANEAAILINRTDTIARRMTLGNAREKQLG